MRTTLPRTNKSPQDVINGLEVDIEMRMYIIFGDIDLSCSHIYHSACSDPWLEINLRHCPYCRRLVIDELEKEPKPILNQSLS